MTMTPEQRMARAHEIFAAVYGDQPERDDAQYRLETAVRDLTSWIEELDEHVSPSEPPFFTIEHIVKEFRSIVETLDSIDLTEGQ